MACNVFLMSCTMYILDMSTGHDNRLMDQRAYLICVILYQQVTPISLVNGTNDVQILEH